MTVQAPREALEVVARLEATGHEAWLVGGCVRDSLLGRSPGDWDVTTSARPEEIQAACADLPQADVGLRHGTVTVLCGGMPIETTTYRADGAYPDHRRPESVTFSDSLEEDLARRDFTVNAMAWHPARGLADPFGGQEDLAGRRLRCVGDPARRFREDALRILRGLRFAAVLGFSLEEETGRALREARELLGYVSAERIWQEMTRLLCGAWAAEVLREYPEVLFTVLPELAPLEHCPQETPYHCWGVWEHTLHTLEAVEAEAILRWAALLHDSGKPGTRTLDEAGVAHFYGHDQRSAELAREILARLKAPMAERETVTELVALHSTPLDPPGKRITRLLARLGEENFFRLLALKRGDSLAHAPAYREERIAFIEAARARAKELLARQEPLAVRDLVIGGAELKELGVSPGPGMGKVLRLLLEDVWAEKLPNEKEPLLQAAREYMKRAEG